MFGSITLELLNNVGKHYGNIPVPTFKDIRAEQSKLDEIPTWAGTLTVMSQSFEDEAKRNNKAVRDGFEAVIFGVDK